MNTPSALGAQQEAVSPVVGTILLVAITVTLSATAFVIASNFNNTPNQAPSIQFLIDSRTGQISIIRSDAGIDLSDIEVQMSVPGVFNYNAQATSTAGNPLTPDIFAKLADSQGTTMKGGDYISFCADSAGSGITVSIRYPPANQMLYANSFTTLAECGA